MTTLKACGPILERHKQALGVNFYERLFLENPDLRGMFNMSNKGAQAASLANAVIAFCGHCDQLEELGPAVARITQKHTSVAVRPEQYAVVGGTLLASMEEVLGKEVFNEPVKAAVTEGYFFLADILQAEEAGLARERMAAEGGWHGWREFRLAGKEEDTRVHTTFTFAPTDGGRVSPHRPGQYITLRLRPPGAEHPVVRHYTLTGAGEGEYRITVKRENKGLVSLLLHLELQVGDLLELTAPAGAFTLRPEAALQVFIGAGTGVTPLMGMMAEAAARPDTQALFLYRGQHPLLQPLRPMLASLLAGSPQLAAVASYKVAALRPEPPVPRLRLLPPGMDWSAATLGPLLPGPQPSVYICGPPGFTALTREILHTLGVEQTNISFECFGPEA